MRAAWPEIYRIVRYLAAVDSSLAHLFAFHHLQLATIQLFANAQQQDYWLRLTLDQNWFWGNATNGRDTHLQLVPQDEHYQLLGSKSFCSGALGSDALVVSVPRTFGSQERVFLVIPAQRDGLLINDDWDGFGQRQTDSGTVHFEGVYVDAADLLEYGLNSPRASLRTCVSQLILVQIYLGNAAGALSGSAGLHQRAGTQLARLYRRTPDRGCADPAAPRWTLGPTGCRHLVGRAGGRAIAATARPALANPRGARRAGHLDSRSQAALGPGRAGYHQ